MAIFMLQYSFLVIVTSLVFGCSSSKNTIQSVPEWFSSGEKYVDTDTFFVSVSASNISEEKAVQSARVSATTEFERILFVEAYERTVALFVEEINQQYDGYNPEGLAALRSTSYPQIFRDYITISQKEVQPDKNAAMFDACVTFSFPLSVAREQVLISLSTDEEWGIAFKNSESYKIFLREYPYLSY